MCWALVGVLVIVSPSMSVVCFSHVSLGFVLSVSVCFLSRGSSSSLSVVVAVVGVVVVVGGVVFGCCRLVWSHALLVSVCVG